MENIIGVIDGQSETEKVEILLERNPVSGDRLHLRTLAWGEGIGWYPQKTIAFPCGQIATLQTILNQAGAILSTASRKAPSAKGQILPFPRRARRVRRTEERRLKEA